MQALRDGDAVNLAFADGDSPSYRIQFSQLHPLRVLLHRDGSRTASLGLAEPAEKDVAGGSAMNDLVFR